MNKPVISDANQKIIDFIADMKITGSQYSGLTNYVNEIFNAVASQLAEDSRDAKRWRMFVKALRTKIDGPGHGTRIKVIEVCPMYGEEKEVDNITALIDATIGAKK